LSGLNKALIGLLIVLSLLLSSAVIVWVNKTEDYKLASTQAQAKLNEERKAHDAASAEAQTAKEGLQSYVKTANAQIEDLQSALKAKEQEVSKRDVQLADLGGQVRQQSIALVSTGEALKASEIQKKQQQEQLADLRTIIDKIHGENARLDQTVSDLTAKNEVLNREFKYVKEQLAESQGTNDRLMGQVKDLGGNPAVVAVGGLKAGAPAINGVVREVKTLDDNRQWATISVGSADAVAKGMEFKVIDRASGSFLGVLTVDRVEANEAIGVLAGPKVAEVKPGSEVRTQL
jgi:chromosome segregation ATPase